MIEVKNLTKQYGAFTAVDNISFKLQKGHIYGFLGPNGAGKSTTMNMLCGCLSLSGGSVIIDGHNIVTDPQNAKRKIGYLPENPPLYLDMTPLEYLEFVGSAKGLNYDELLLQMKTVMEKTGIIKMRHRLIKNLSKGYKQRLGIAGAMIGDPPILILDEPTSGLDPEQIIEIRKLISEFRSTNKIVILSTHLLSEVTSVCDSVLVISNGRLVADSAIDELIKSHTEKKITKVVTRGNFTPVLANLRAISSVTNINSTQIKDSQQNESAIIIEYNRNADIRINVQNTFIKASLPILEFTDITPTLEEIYIKLTSSVKGTEREAVPVAVDDGFED